MKIPVIQAGLLLAITAGIVVGQGVPGTSVTLNMWKDAQGLYNVGGNYSLSPGHAAAFKNFKVITEAVTWKDGQWKKNEPNWTVAEDNISPSANNPNMGTFGIPNPPPANPTGTKIKLPAGGATSIQTITVP